MSRTIVKALNVNGGWSLVFIANCGVEGSECVKFIQFKKLIYLFEYCDILRLHIDNQDMLPLERNLIRSA